MNIVSAQSDRWLLAGHAKVVHQQVARITPSSQCWKKFLACGNDVPSPMTSGLESAQRLGGGVRGRHINRSSTKGVYQ